MPVSLDSLGRNLRRLRTLDGEQRLVGLAALVAIPILHMLFRYAGLRAVRLVLREGPAPSVGSTVDAVDLGRHLAVPVYGAATMMKLGDRSCLSRAWFLWWLLRRRRIAAIVVIGSRASEAGLEAHAWVEIDGHPVDDTADVRCRFPVLASAGAAGEAILSVGE